MKTANNKMFMLGKCFFFFFIACRKKKIRCRKKYFYVYAVEKFSHVAKGGGKLSLDV